MNIHPTTDPLPPAALSSSLKAAGMTDSLDCGFLDQSCWTRQAGVSDPFHIPLYNLCSSGQHHQPPPTPPRVTWQVSEHTPGGSQKPQRGIRKHTLTAYLPSKPSTDRSFSTESPAGSRKGSLGQHPRCRRLPRAP